MFGFAIVTFYYLYICLCSQSNLKEIPFFLVGNMTREILQYLTCYIKEIRVPCLISIYSDHVNSSHI